MAGIAPDTVYIRKNASGMGKIISLAKEKGAVVKETAAEKLELLCGTDKHGGVVMTAAVIEYADVDEILAVSAQRKAAPFIIALDGIQDPHNLGAIIRTAEAAGADGIIIPKRRSAAVNSTVYKTSAGAAGWIKIARVNSLVPVLEKLKKKNIWIYGAEADGSPFTKADLTCGVCLVIGSEGYGMSRLVREVCDGVLSIDMFGRINSLNASVSAGVLIYEAVRQRKELRDGRLLG